MSGSHGRSGKHSGRSRADRFGDAPRSYYEFETIGQLLTDILIAAVLLIFPFVMGGREAIGHQLLVTAAFAMGVTWCLHRMQTGGRLVLLSLEPLVIAGLLLVIAQSTPVGESVLSRLSPEYPRLLSGWSATQSGNVWKTISFTPVETRHAVWMLASYAVIGIVIAQRLQNDSDCRKLLKLVALSGLLMAGFAVFQFATSNDRFFWFYRHPFTGTKDVLKGAFTNRNHFAQFLALSVGPLIWWLVSARREREERDAQSIRRGLGAAQGNHSQFDNLIDVRQLLLLCGIAGVLLAVMISLSRGGMLAAGLSSCVCLGGLWKSGCVRSSLTAAVLGIAVVVAGGVATLGGEQLDDRLNKLASGDANQIDEMQARRTLWKADLKAIQKFPILGTGVGSHREVYPIYMAELCDFSRWEFTHAESSWIHLTLETGLVGVGLVVLGLLYILMRILRTLLSRNHHGRGEYLAAILGSLVAGMVHAAFDFIWYVPAIVVTTIALAVTGLRLSTGFQSARAIPMPRVGWMSMGIVSVLALITVQADLTKRTLGERYYNQFLTATLDVQRSALEEARNEEEQLEELAGEVDPAEPVAEEETTVADYRQRNQNEVESIDSMRSRMILLMKSLKANPRQPRVQLNLALLSLKMFGYQQRHSDNPIDLVQIRDAALSADFPDQQALQEWLNRAFPKAIRLAIMADSASRQTLKYCPIQGDAYLTLASTGFLKDPEDKHHDSMIAQAILVRGNDPRVRFIAGREALAAGRQEDAMREWNAVFHANQERRRTITEGLAALAPASFLIEQFEPSPQELLDVLKVHRAIGRKPDLEQILSTIERLEDEDFKGTSNEARVALLMEAYQTCYDLQNRERAETFVRTAVDVAEDPYWPRRALGLLLYENSSFEEAGEHFMWCYEQHPGDVKLEYLIKESRRLAIRQEVPTIRASWQNR